MHAGLVVMVIGVGWSMLAFAVAIVVGTMARERDVRAGPSVAPPARDDGFRTAI